MKSVRVIAAISVTVVVLVSAGAFVVSPNSSTQEAVDFEDTVSIGLTLEERQTIEAHGRLVPRVQVAYSQYPFVVGYRGIGQAAEAVDDPLVRQQFGYAQSVHVEVAPTDVDVDSDGYLHGEPTNEWIPADEAVFVTDTDARTPGVEATVAFESRTAAGTFAERHGGRLLEWDDRTAFEAREADGAVANDRVDAQHAEADERVATAFESLDRPESVVVGEDAETIQDAVETADPNSTIRLPPGVYEESVTIDRPVSIRGENATVVGDGNGSVVTVTASDVAIEGVSISGVGEVSRPDDVTPEGWDGHTEAAYGHADAGITIADSDRVLVTDVEIDTPTSGIAIRDSNGTVVDDVVVRGADTWEDGFMGVVTVRSRIVVQQSTFVDGRDGVYTLRSHGAVIRDNRFDGGRFGTHLMYTSDALIDGNCIHGQTAAGIVIMTSPSRTVIRENVLVDASQGILTSGSDSYIGGNVVVASQHGISTNARNSLYSDNVLVGNEVGFVAASVVPTSRVVNNDVIDNDEHVLIRSGPLRVWSHDGEGNYWSGAADLKREFTPTGPVDGILHRTTAATTLAASPAARSLRQLRTETPGMRSESVVDASPRATPANDSRVEFGSELRDEYDRNGAVECPTESHHQ